MHLTHRPPGIACILPLLTTILAVLPSPAAAHVKWFCGPIDVSVPPLSLAAVLSPLFLANGIAFLLLISAGSLIDALAARRWPRRIWRSRHLETIEALLIRLGVGAYALCLWDKSAVVPWGAAAEGAILTPELLDQDHWISLLQLAVAFLLLSRRTCPLAALGLVALYAVGIARYGVFHMTDYAYFLGLAAYLALSTPAFDQKPHLRAWRVPLAVGGLAFSLMWTAVEKFLYPTWTATVLAVHPSLTLGFPIPFVTVTAGFVEFSLAFYLLVGRSLLRLDALLFGSVFLAAIPEFGGLDRVGHLPIVAILLLVAMHGATPLQEAAQPRRAGPIRSAATIAGLYAASLVAMTTMYYGLAPS